MGGGVVLLASATGESKAWAHGTLAEHEMLGVIYGGGKVDRQRVKRRGIEHCRAICDPVGEKAFRVCSNLWQFQRYLDFWKREEWQDLAAAAVGVLNQGETRATGVSAGSGEMGVTTD